MVVEEPTSRTRLVHGFGLQDLEGVVVPHNGMHLCNLGYNDQFDEAQVFMVVGSSINVLF